MIRQWEKISMKQMGNIDDLSEWNNLEKYSRQQNYSSTCNNSYSENSYLMRFYEINIYWIMIFSIYTVVKKHYDY